MEKANTLNQMDRYDFSTPISVTMIFEDSADDVLFTNVLGEQVLKDINEQNKNKKINRNPNATSKVQTTNGKLKKNSVTVKEKSAYYHEILSHHVKENKFAENSSPIHEESSASKIIEGHQSPLIQNNCIAKATEDVRNIMFETHQMTNDNKKQDDNVKNLLDVVSENLILIMRFYYHYYYKKLHNDSEKVTDLTKQWDRLKAHFFDLSYSTVVSLILPQEKNEIFINNFLNKTVADANKTLQCQCERKNVEPFYNEMILWVKRKREYLKSFGLKNACEQKRHDEKKNENKTLKERLADPPLKFYVPHLTNASKQLKNIGTVPTAPSSNSYTCDEDSMCIFSSGDPERQITININPTLLRDQTNQRCLTNSYISNSDSSATNPIHNSRQGHIDRNQRVDQAYQNGYYHRNTIHYKPIPPRPPPYYAKQHHITSSVTPTTFRNLNQIQENFAPAVQNYQTQQNSDSFASSARSDPNSRIMYYRNSEEDLATKSPVITDVTSLNPQSWTSHPALGRCCICGKSTTTRCSKCNNYSYCSFLCQELDTGCHNATCKKT